MEIFELWAWTSFQINLALLLARIHALALATARIQLDYRIYFRAQFNFDVHYFDVH